MTKKQEVQRVASKAGPASRAVSGSRLNTKSAPKDGRQQRISTPVVRMLMADDIRAEQSGKMFAVGLYPDNVLVLNLPRSTPAPSAKKPIALDGLSLLFTFLGSAGHHDVSISIGDGAAKVLSVNVPEGGHANIILALRPLLIREFGVKPVLVLYGGAKHDFEFEVRRRDVESAPGRLAAIDA